MNRGDLDPQHSRDSGSPTRRPGALVASALVLAGSAGLLLTGPDGALIEAGRLLLRVGLWGSVLFACATLAGRAVGSSLAGLAHLAWDGLSGLALLAALLVAVGQLPGAYTTVMLMTILAGLLLLAVLLAAGSVRREREDEGSGSWTLALLAVPAVAGLFWNRVPALFYDTLAYHFAQPNLWLVEGRLAPVEWSLHSWFPPGMSALYGVGLAVGGDTLANDANLLVGLLLLVAVWDLARRLWGEPAGWLAAAWLLTLPLWIHAAAIPAADLAHGAFTFGTLGALWLHRRSGNRCWLLRAGLLAGGAMLTKYLGFLVPTAAVLAWMLFFRGGEAARPGRSLRAATLFAALAMALVAPWLLANSVVLGNPVAPVLAGALPVEGLEDGAVEVFLQDARSGFPVVDEIVRLPGRLVSGHEEDDALYPGPALGWAPLVMLAAALFVAREDRAVRTGLIVAALLAIFWLISFRWERFLVAASALLAVVFGAAAVLVWKRSGAARVLPCLAGVLAVLAVIRSTFALLAFTGAWSVVTGREAADPFVHRSLPITALYAEASGTLDASQHRVLVIGEMRHHRLSIPHVAPTGFNVHPLTEALRESVDQAEVSARLESAGFSHVIVDKPWALLGANRYPSLAILRERPDLLDPWLESLGPPLGRAGHARLWRLPEAR